MNLPSSLLSFSFGKFIDFATSTEGFREDQNNGPQRFPNDTRHYPQMKLTKYGYYKKKRITTLVDEELTASYHSGWGAIWRQDPWGLLLHMKGIPGKATHNYELEFSPDELALLVEIALTDASKATVPARAIGAFIRELLDVKNKPADT